MVATLSAVSVGKHFGEGSFPFPFWFNVRVFFFSFSFLSFGLTFIFSSFFQFDAYYCCTSCFCFSKLPLRLWHVLLF